MPDQGVPMNACHGLLTAPSPSRPAMGDNDRQGKDMSKKNNAKNTGSGKDKAEANKTIAQDMHLSHKTVSTYRTRIIIKLNVKSLVHLRDFAKRNHLL